MFRDLFKSKSPSRVLPERSTREISDARKRLRSELRASLYLYNDEKFIVCAIADISEYGEPAVLNKAVSDEVLGQAVCDKLLDYKTRLSRNPKDQTLDEWAAYQASGAGSAKSFEEKCIFVYITTINAAIRIEAAPRLTNEQDLQALCTVPNTRMHADIGVAVRKAIKAAQVLRDAGML